MLTVYNCIVNEHDFRLVGLAAVICTLASFTAVTLLHHVGKSSGIMRFCWLAVSATATGFGIWATHFIAMLAFSPGVASGYNIVLTLFSLVAAIVLTGIGLCVAMSTALPGAPGSEERLLAAALRPCTTPACRLRSRRLDHLNPTLIAASIVLGAIVAPSPCRSACAATRSSGGLRCAAAHRRDLQPPLHRDGRGFDRT